MVVLQEVVHREMVTLSETVVLWEIVVSWKNGVPGKVVLQGKWGPGDGSVREKYCSGRQ